MLLAKKIFMLSRFLINNSLADLKEDVEHRSRVILKFQTRDWNTGSALPAADLVSALKTAAHGGWSLALVPPPTEEQLRVISPILRGMENRHGDTETRRRGE